MNVFVWVRMFQFELEARFCFSGEFVMMDARVDRGGSRRLKDGRRDDRSRSE